jgi:hypothetical protein
MISNKNTEIDGISGSIGYIKMRHEGKLYIFFLDNHESTEYCKGSVVFVHEIFDQIFPNNDYNLFVEEPMEKDLSLQLLYKTQHIEKYLQYLEGKQNAHRFDLRFRLDKTNITDTFHSVQKFLEKVKTGYKPLDNHKRMIMLFIYHSLKYYVKNKIPKKGHGALLLTRFPFIDGNTLVKLMSIDYVKEILLNSIMEFYLIVLLLASNKPNNIIYLGAAHGIVVTRLLESRYGFVIEKDVQMPIGEVFNLKNLDALKSCIN